MISGISGVKSGLYVWEYKLFEISIFPVWNVFIGIFFIYSSSFIEEIPFDQTDAKPLQILFSLAVISLILYTFRFVFHGYWAIVFSICVSYSFCINRAILKAQWTFES